MSIAMAVERISRDMRIAARALMARRMWSAAALACLAIAIGSSIAAFTIMRALFLRPLPFADPEQLVMVAISERGKGPRPFSLADYDALTQSSGTEVELMARTYSPVSLAVNGERSGAEAEIVSANYFQTLRVAPFLGQFFGPQNNDNAPVVVLSYRLWSQRFHSNLTAIGSNVTLGASMMRVVGIAPPDFVGATSLIASDLWVPLSQYGAITGSVRPSDARFTVMGRMQDGMTTHQLRRCCQPGSSLRNPAYAPSRASSSGGPLVSACPSDWRGRFSRSPPLSMSS